MTLRSVTRRTIFGLGVLLTLALSYSSFIAAVDQLPDSRTIGQKAQTYCQFAYALLGIALSVTPFLRRPWEITLQGAWAATLTAAGGLASVVWSGTTIGVGVVGGVATLLIALVLIWILRVGAPRGAIPSTKGDGIVDAGASANPDS